MEDSKLANVAMEAIRKGPKWNPALKNDKPVNAYRIQPISFKIEEK